MEAVPEKFLSFRSSFFQNFSIVDGYRTFEAYMDRFKGKLDKFMIMMAKLYQISLPFELLSMEYPDLIIKQKRSVPVTVEDPLLLENDVIHRTPQVNLLEDLLSKEKDEQILKDNEFPFKEDEQSELVKNVDSLDIPIINHVGDESLDIPVTNHVGYESCN